jgi:hypothetical protein
LDAYPGVSGKLIWLHKVTLVGNLWRKITRKTRKPNSQRIGQVLISVIVSFPVSVERLLWIVNQEMGMKDLKSGIEPIAWAERKCAIPFFLYKWRKVYNRLR